MQIHSSIKSIYINAFSSCKYLRAVEFEANSQMQIFGSSSLADILIEKMSIPIHVKKYVITALKIAKILQKLIFLTILNSK